MAQLSIEQAKATAKTALSFLAAFDGEDFGFLREDTPGPHDRRHLAIALDHVQELAAMVLNLADRVPTEQPKSDRAPDGRTYIRSHTPGCNCKECMPPNQLIVRNSLSNAELHAAIDALGYKPMTDIRNARSIMCFSQAEALAAREPIVKFFNEDGSAK